MERKEVALCEQKTLAKVFEETRDQEKQIDMLNSKIATIESLVTYLYQKIEKDEEDVNVYTEPATVQKSKDTLITTDLNKDGIPVNTVLIGVTCGRPFVLTASRYDYSVGDKRYDTLSAAAEGVSGNRRSGWVFWKTFDGRTAKEAFNKD